MNLRLHFHLHFAVACGALLAGLAHAGLVRIELRPQALLDKHRVTLGDVASIAAEDDSLGRTLAETTLATFGDPVKPRTLSRARIERVLNRQLPALQGSYRFSGAESVQLAWAGQALDIDQLRAWSEATLSARLKQAMPYASLEVRAYPLAWSAAFHLPPGQISYEMRHASLAPVQRMTMVVDVLVDRVKVGAVPVSLRVQGSQPTWRLKDRTAAGSALGADMLEQVDAPVADRPVLTASAQAIATMKLRRELPAATILAMDDVVARNTVERGKDITVRIARGGLSVEDRGVAMTDGASGASVRVMNPRTRSDYLVTVVGDGLAEAR